MTDILSLLKANPLLPAEDFAWLRKQGIKHIEETGSAIWTDYNTSDPGITMLEAVCYAITDLAYRTGFEVKDLLAPENLTKDTWKQVFYTARQILHNSPLTLTDYRKLIIDVKGVRNAWVEASKDYEVPVWVDYNFSALDPHKDCSCDDHHIEECYGKLGLNAATKESVIEDKKEFVQHITEEIDQVQEEIDELTEEEKESKLPALKEKLKAFKKLREKREKEIEDITDDTQKIIDSKIVEFEGLYNVMIEYEEDVLEDRHRAEVRELVYRKLLRNRNLCEDFLSVNAVEYEDFAIGASISLAEYADPDQVLAQIFFVIYKYFTPSVPFHTIPEMLEKGYGVDEIFEGPALDHGFIDTAELEKTDLFRDIRLSDIISEIADIDGIKAITYLHLPFTDFTKPDSGKNYFYQWLQRLKDERKIGRIQPRLSKVIFCKERDIITYYTGEASDRRPERMLKLFKDLKTLERKYKLELKDADLDFAVPSGEYMELEDYYPVTYSLPMCYGVSERAGVPPNADEKRKVQALQLKGYLMFFEQLLGDYLVQLNHFRDLFTFDNTVKHTYFTRALTEIDDLKSLVIDNADHGDNHWNLILNDFRHVLQNLVETPKMFSERRNIFLNHMLARFGEDISEYETVTRWLTPNNVDERLVQDKIRILKDGEYYKISTKRGRGYDYTQQKLWDTSNVSGAERRLSRLLGFADANRKTLSTDYIIIEAVHDMGHHHHHSHHNKKKNIIKLVDPDNKETVLLTSVEVSDGCCTGQLIDDILAHADDRRYFVFLDGGKSNRYKNYHEPTGPFSFELYDDENKEEAVLLARSEQFEKIEERNAAFKKLRKLMERINNNEGLHLVEHLLLRPRIDEVFNERNHSARIKLPDICLDVCDLGIGLNEGTDVPLYHKKIHRIPPEKCFDEMPWILEYIRNKDNKSILFQKTFADGSDPVDLKFRRYDRLAKRVRELQEFGSERINYEIVWNGKVQADKIKYSFIIHGSKNEVLAQSPFIFDKKEDKLFPNPVDIEEEIESLMEYFGYELDFYCEANPCDNNEDPFSFRTTVVLPCWPKRFRDLTFRNLVEKTIQTEFPAHVHTRVIWVGLQEMRHFESIYKAWLREMANTDLPSYKVVNPLVHLLDTIQPCGCCEDDCDHGHDHDEHGHSKHGKR
ncbi:MAG: hypothetical protein ABIR18_13095 [Chitinophagaceae bacterium]